MMAQTTQTRLRMCLYGIYSHGSPFRGSNPKKKQFWGVNRRFQAKLAKSKNMHIIKTTASIPTKCCTVIKTTKCPSWVVQHTHHKSKMADSRHLEKSKMGIIKTANINVKNCSLYTCTLLTATDRKPQKS